MSYLALTLYTHASGVPSVTTTCQNAAEVLLLKVAMRHLALSISCSAMS